MSVSNPIAIYQSYHTCGNSFLGLQSIVTLAFGTITTVKPESIKEWLEKEGHCLILPGGSSSGWDSELPDNFQEMLGSWVRKGNRIFATCAGAYYCSQESSFCVPNKEPMLKNRSVKLFFGRCVGPVYPNLKVVKIQWHNGKVGHVALFWGGVFEGDKNENWNVLGKFSCKKTTGPAVIQCFSGEGMGILSSVHWEWNGYDVAKCNPTMDTNKLRKKLDDSAQFRMECLHDMMQRMV